VFKRWRLLSLGGLLVAAALLSRPGASISVSRAQQEPATATPIKHLVVIYGENVSFDHYFGTYPYAANPPGEPAFTPAPDTPAVNGLSGALMTNNPNLVNPFRLDRTQALTCDMDHSYTNEQKAFNSGLMDKFVQYTEGKPSNDRQYCPADANGDLMAVMGYYDGNTVTALWNYAQNFAMSDNSYGTRFGPSTPGALDVTAADTGGVICGPAGSGVYGNVPPCGDPNTPPPTSTSIALPSNGNTGAVYGDPQPLFDICSRPDASKLVAIGSKNIGDLLNAAGITWGWFQGGFRTDSNGKCSAAHAVEAYDRVIGVDPATDNAKFGDYIPHHEPFQYFASTANPQHLPPSSVQMIGRTDQANHQYDIQDFYAALDAGILPAVTYLKAPAYQDGHAAYSDPLDEQQFVVTVINKLMQSPFWSSTAVIIAYDDSDGWYDHVMGPIVTHSATEMDVACGTSNDGTPGRCGYGPRLPLLVISPYARKDYVSHAITDQSSIVRFIEDNWLGGQRLGSETMDNMAGSLLDMFDFTQKPTRTLLLDPVTGQPQSGR